ncbi:MAG: HypC/HybG/HupF family hydrogenase formation chaperone [Sorangiineae bacterium PRO1]|nr:HypC/HybG/HupF family hydrogenase formation chaperone [Sorangiineae bacterium PRO1]
MCLGVPGRVVAVDDSDADLLMGRVEFGGVKQNVCLAHVPDAKPGDWVLVHVGFALTRISEAEAARTFELLRELDAASERGE